MAIVSAVAGLATSVCCLGITLSFAAIEWLGPMVLLFGLAAIMFLVASFFSKSRRGSFLFGSCGAVFGIGVPIWSISWLLSHVFGVVGTGM